jgi:hypothetical protein
MEQSKVEEGSIGYRSVLRCWYIQIITLLNFLYLNIISDGLHLEA